MPNKTFHMVAEVKGYVAADVEAGSMDEAVAKMNQIVQESNLGALENPDWNAPSGHELPGLPAFARTELLTADDVIEAAKPYLDVKPNHGRVMAIERFVEDVESRCITDYDGSGLLVLDGKIVDGSVLILEWASVRIGSELIVPLAMLRDLLGERVAVLWFNK